MPFPSPTTISAVKLNRRPPLTTLETRLIVTIRSMRLLFSPESRPPRPPRSSRRPRPPSRPPPRLSRLSRLSVLDGPAPLACSAIMQSFRKSSSSEFEPAFARGVSQRCDPSAIGVPTAVEHHGLDTCGLGALGDQLSDPDAVGLLVAVDRTHVGLDGRRRGQRDAVLVVDQLHVDVPRGAVHHQARGLRRARDLLAEPGVPAQPSHPTGLGDVLPDRRPLGGRFVVLSRSHVLLTCLSDLAADLLTLVANALALVRVW